MAFEPRFLESELTEPPEPPTETIGTASRATKESVGLTPLSSASTSAKTFNGVRSSNLRADQVPHPLEHREALLSCIRLLDARRLSSLPNPLPRAQDLPEDYFSTPTGGDQVVSVSHAWRNQAHPDPTCHKTRVLSKLLSNIQGEMQGQDKEQSKLLLFFDFTSIPQRPFQAGHKPRTDDQMSQFRQALSAMHEMYFFSDRIIHLPWEDCVVSGEGTEVSASTADLRGATFDEAGGIVQVAAAPRGVGTAWKMQAMLGTARVQLFDQVVSVDNELITSIEQLESLLQHDGRHVRLHRYPFGVSNTIPADARGWVFLERFITMVKCAMMDEDTARKVVVSPCESIRRQIMEGACRLREASVLDLKSGFGEAGELKQVLDSFTEEMQRKQFSAASTDKRLLEAAEASSVEADRDVVSGIMQQFIQHLKDHWQAEAAEQQKLGHRLKGVVAATKTFLTEWDCFSERYASELAAASTGNPWPVVLMVFVPLLPALYVMSLPLAQPDEGWAAQGLFWTVGLPPISALCCCSLLLTLISMTGMPYTRRLVFGLVICLSCYSLVLPAVGIGISMAFDIFPLPMTHFLGSTLATLILPVLFFCIPAEQRSDRDVRWRAIYSMAALLTLVGVFAFVFPILNALIPLVSTGWQALVVSAYLAAKLMFEAVGLKLSQRLGADVMPLFLCWATCCYQFNLCMVFTSVDSWLIIVEQIVFDVLENGYHLWSLGRQRGRRQEQYIVASLALREFLEVIAPSQFLCIYSFLDARRSNNTSFFCSRDERGVRQSQFFLLVDIAVELSISFLTFLYLVRRGHEPLRLLRGLLATRQLTLLTIVTVVVVFYICMAHGHWGMDLSFGWRWIFEEDARWVCGLTWESAA